MKKNKLHIVILLVFYLFGTFQFVLPYFEYVVNYDFIVHNLCEQKDELENMCMGKCHLNKELVNKIKEMQNKPENKEKEFNFLMLSFHFQDLQKDINIYTSLRQYFTQYLFPVLNNFTVPVLQPPQFC